MDSEVGMAESGVRTPARQRAEAILARIGISRSAALELYYQQIIAHDGLPFPLPPPPKARDEMTDEEFDRMMETGLRQAKEGQFCDAKAFFDELERRP
ncbi:MAG: type II toxin-antitoxin system RelB/DinJ family antitoxin [Oscillibacter sp.]|nr:type II toxin-antitoxin system RelB/DinJ family antitoxin [Oscillibacter sp.]